MQFNILNYSKWLVLRQNNIQQAFGYVVKIFSKGMKTIIPSSLHIWNQRVNLLQKARFYHVQRYVETWIR